MEKKWKSVVEEEQMKMGKKIFLKIKKGGWRGAALQGRGQTVGRQGEEPRSSLPGESCLHLRIPNRLAEER